MVWQSVNRPLNSSHSGLLNYERFGRGFIVGHARDILRGEFNGHSPLQSGTGTKKGVPHDAKYPCSEIGGGLKGPKAAEGLEIGLLYQVFGLMVIPREPASEVVGRIHQGDSQLLKVGDRRILRWYRCRSATDSHAAVFD